MPLVLLNVTQEQINACLLMGQLFTIDFTCSILYADPNKKPVIETGLEDGGSSCPLVTYFSGNREFHATTQCFQDPQLALPQF